MQIYIGDPDDDITVDQAVSLAPSSWTQFYLKRHEHGWIFIASGGIRYLLDTGEEGWCDLDDETAKIYERLGKQTTELYIIKEQK